MLILTVGAVFALQAFEESVRLCVPDDSNHVASTIGFRRKGGQIWWTPEGASGRRLFVSGDHVTARNRSWHAGREPLIIDGQTFAYAGPYRVVLAFNRYYRNHDPIDGVAAAVPLGAEGEVVLVLTDPIGCWFAEYRAAAPQSPPPPSEPPSEPPPSW